MAGKSAIYMESLTDECMLDVIDEILAKCFPKLNLPRPKSIIRLLVINYVYEKKYLFFLTFIKFK